MLFNLQVSIQISQYKSLKRNSRHAPRSIGMRRGRLWEYLAGEKSEMIGMEPRECDRRVGKKHNKVDC